MSVDIPDIANPLLAWYGAHARVLPWRSPPGMPPPDSYRVWLSEVMLQQTTVAAVIPFFNAFVTRWPTVGALAAADEAEVMAAWAGLGYYSRARNLIACARDVATTGAFPDTEADLRALPGLGAYTAAAVAAIAFDQPAVVVDGNVERVVARLFAVDTPLPAARPELRRLTGTITPPSLCGDFAQAMMDLGSTICTPRAPKCLICPLSDRCAARAEGDPAHYPRRAPKAEKPHRHATAWWIESDGRVLLVRRPPRGLLGGMLALPSTLGLAPPEVGAAAGAHADPLPAPACAEVTLGHVTHVFTHFRLTMAVRRVPPTPGCVLPPGGEWWCRENLMTAGLPTVFAKAVRVAMAGV